ncbi:type II secretion system protein [Wenzhouxiangella sp. AB-CW3]|uniref:type II secretion system protein n=1 Tax=Wenzhouxiangella sp. AB-CW3 TaxID=2771012 RepID=UPI00168A88F8|nr:type II secretion system protein [Wenzhouxiangella sp. AB-CW3]QOC23828.1 type II secretion system protein [Wenzhouxiangella sp. AB-CW3]
MCIARPTRGRPGQGGFTLIELILVMVLVGILAAVSVTFILPPFQAAADLERRAALVDSADLALNRMTREARSALPNSVRVSPDNQQVEFVTTLTGGRYRRLPTPGDNSDPFVPAQSSGSFDVLGGLIDADEVQERDAGRSCGYGNGHCLSVYNTGQPGFDVYSGQNIAAITNASSGSISYDSGGSDPAFATHSPNQRFYVVDTVVSYVCEGNQLLRFSDYGIDSSPSGSPALVTGNIESCQFSYAEGTSARRGLLTLRLDLADGGEQIFLVAQAQVLNSP